VERLDRRPDGGQSLRPGLGRLLGVAIEESTPPMSLSATGGVFLQAFRDDPEVDRLLSGLYGP
jgi:hypothetical protein